MLLDAGSPGWQQTQEARQARFDLGPFWRRLDDQLGPADLAYPVPAYANSVLYTLGRITLFGVLVLNAGTTLILVWRNLGGLGAGSVMHHAVVLLVESARLISTGLLARIVVQVSSSRRARAEGETAGLAAFTALLAAGALAAILFGRTRVHFGGA